MQEIIERSILREIEIPYLKSSLDIREEKTLAIKFVFYKNVLKRCMDQGKDPDAKLIEYMYWRDPIIALITMNEAYAKTPQEKVDLLNQLVYVQSAIMCKRYDNLDENTLEKANEALKILSDGPIWQQQFVKSIIMSYPGLSSPDLVMNLSSLKLTLQRSLDLGDIKRYDEFILNYETLKKQDEAVTFIIDKSPYSGMLAIDKIFSKMSEHKKMSIDLARIYLAEVLLNQDVSVDEYEDCLIEAKESADNIGKGTKWGNLFLVRKIKDQNFMHLMAITHDMQ